MAQRGDDQFRDRSRARKASLIQTGLAQVSSYLLELKREGTVSDEEYWDPELAADLREAVSDQLQQELDGDEDTKEVGELVREIVGQELARIFDLKLGDKGVEDMHRLCSCVNRAQGSLREVDTQWVRAKISPFNSPSTGFCASIFKGRG